MRFRRFLISVTHRDLALLLQLAFRLQPILTVMARVAAALQIDLIGAVLDYLRIKVALVVRVFLVFVLVVLHIVVVVPDLSAR